MITSLAAMMSQPTSPYPKPLTPLHLQGIMIMPLSENPYTSLELLGPNLKCKCVVGWDGMWRRSQGQIRGVCYSQHNPSASLPRKSGNPEGRGDITLWNLIGEFSRLPELAQYVVTMNVDCHSQNK